MPLKLTIDDVKTFIKNEGDKLISTEYTNNKTLLDIRCKTCKKVYKQSFDRYKRGNRHQKCPIKKDYGGNLETNPLMIYNTTRTVHYLDKICIACKKEFKVAMARKNQKVCNVDCRRLLEKQKAAEGYYKKLGHIGGCASAAVQVKRSKNEVMFAELCENTFEFEDVRCNEPIFEGWDSDVILLTMKIAIAWNGIWHYKQVRKDHDLDATRRRDAHKKKIIQKMGFTYYIIKDMGGFSKKLVETEFRKLCDFIYFL